MCGDAKHGWLARDEVRSPASRAAPPTVAPKSYNRRWPRSAVICSHGDRRRLCCRRYSFRSTPAAFTVAAHRDYFAVLRIYQRLYRCARRRLHRPPLLIGSTLAVSAVCAPHLSPPRSAFSVAVLRVASAGRIGGSTCRRRAECSHRTADPCYVGRKGRQPPPHRSRLTPCVSTLTGRGLDAALAVAAAARRLAGGSSSLPSPLSALTSRLA